MAKLVHFSTRFVDARDDKSVWRRIRDDDDESERHVGGLTSPMMLSEYRLSTAIGVTSGSARRIKTEENEFSQ